MSRPLSLAAAASLLGECVLQAQTMRDFTVERVRRGESRLHAVVDFAAGTIAVRPGKVGALYRMQLRYDAERFVPRGEYDPEELAVRLGLERRGGTGLRVVNREHLAQTAVVELAPDLPLSLEARLGAAEATLDLGGLALEDLSVSSGASRTEVRFGRPNPARCRLAEFSSGAAELVLAAMGNSGCSRVSVSGGVGALTLGLSGAWPEDARVNVHMALGGVTILAPRDLGIRLRLSRFLSGFNPEGFVKQGGAYVSGNYAGARRRVEIEVETTLGEVRVEWR